MTHLNIRKNYVSQKLCFAKISEKQSTSDLIIMHHLCECTLYARDIVYYSRGLPARIVGILAGARRQILILAGRILAGAQKRTSRKHRKS